MKKKKKKKVTVARDQMPLSVMPLPPLLLLLSLAACARAHAGCSGHHHGDEKALAVVVYAAQDNLARAEATVSQVRFAGQHHGDIVLMVPEGEIDLADVQRRLG
jgi:hypothetical protein